MAAKYQHDTERFLRSQAKIYALRGNLQMARNYELCADDVKKLRMAVDLGEQGAEEMRDEVARLKGELAALKGAVGNVVEMHRKGEGHVCTHYPSGRRALDALAALAGEEGK